MERAHLNHPAIAATTPAESGRGRAAKRDRSRPFDGRRREAKRWLWLRDHYVALAGNQHEQTCRALASMVLQREALDAACARGEAVDVDLLLRLSSEIRRGMERIGLLGDLPGEDETDAAIRVLQADEAAA